MKKTETIAFYKEAFLAGKPDDIRRRFEEKDVEKQYSSIIAWRRRQRKANEPQQDEDKEEDLFSNYDSIISYLEQIKEALPHLSELPYDKRETMHHLLDAINQDVHNFDRIKKSQLLSQLESQQEEINRQRDSLQQQIDSLRYELNS